MRIGDAFAKLVMMATVVGFLGFWLYCIFSGNIVGKVG